MTANLSRIALFSSCALLFCQPLVHAQTKIEYNRDVRPILAENCFACHGPDSAARKASLRLDDRDAAIKMGAIVPGKLKDSALIEHIFSGDPKQVMPPPKTRKTLTAAQKETLKRWIAEGAEYQLHWSLLAPQRPALPKVKNEAWVRNPIDRFILAELEKRGMTPNPEADRRTLARRLSLDLTGLPPTPADVEAFVNDKAPDAYEKYVDQMMKSPHYGEHRARYWLDAARYADTHGIHFDNFARCTPIATGSSTPSIGISRSTSSPSTSLPAICCRIRRSISGWRPASTAATSRRTKGA
jgi:hypothetical protein